MSLYEHEDAIPESKVLSFNLFIICIICTKQLLEHFLYNIFWWFHYKRTWETTISLWSKESVISHGICCVVHSSRNNDVYECLLLHFDTKFCKRRQFCGVKQVFFTTHKYDKNGWTQNVVLHSYCKTKSGRYILITFPTRHFTNTYIN